MLEDTAHSSVVAWNDRGDSFVVKVSGILIVMLTHCDRRFGQDMNEFTKSILPRHFKHSNFASFVRQLNKYDFHKVKKPDSSGESGVYGDHVSFIHLEGRSP